MSWSRCWTRPKAGRMPAGRRGHKIREFQRRIDAVLDEAHEFRGPPPPPVSAEHAALREKIIEEGKAIEWCYTAHDWRGLPSCTPESAFHACLALDLIFQEQKLLAQHGVDWRPY